MGTAKMCAFEATLYLRAIKDIHSAFHIHFATSAKFGGRYLTVRVPDRAGTWLSEVIRERIVSILIIMYEVVLLSCSSTRFVCYFVWV